MAPIYERNYAVNFGVRGECASALSQRKIEATLQGTISPWKRQVRTDEAQMSRDTHFSAPPFRNTLTVSSTASVSTMVIKRSSVIRGL